MANSRRLISKSCGSSNAICLGRSIVSRSLSPISFHRILETPKRVGFSRTLTYPLDLANAGTPSIDDGDWLTVHIDNAVARLDLLDALISGIGHQNTSSCCETPRANTYLYSIRSRLNQCLCRLSSHDVTGHQLHLLAKSIFHMCHH